MDLVFLLFFIVGFLFALFGGGGSVLTIPIVMFFFDTSFNEATTYSLVIIFFIALLSTIDNLEKKLISVKSLFLFGMSSITGVFLGRKYLFTYFPEDISIFLFIGIMFLSAFLIIQKNKKILFHISQKSIIAQGLFVGILTSLLGIGGGFLIVPILIIFQNMNIKQAVRSALFLMLLNSFCAICVDFYQIHYQLNLNILVPMILFSIFGMLFGEWMMKRLNVQLLTKMFSFLLIVMGFIFLFNYL